MTLATENAERMLEYSRNAKYFATIDDHYVDHFYGAGLGFYFNDIDYTWTLTFSTREELADILDRLYVNPNLLDAIWESKHKRRNVQS